MGSGSSDLGFRVAEAYGFRVDEGALGLAQRSWVKSFHVLAPQREGMLLVRRLGPCSPWSLRDSVEFSLRFFEPE